MPSSRDALPLGKISKIAATPAAPDPTVPFETSALDLSYPLLGARAYTHGSSMLEGMLAAMRLQVPNLETTGAVIRQFKVIRQFDTLSRAESMKSVNVPNHPHVRDAVARLDVSVSGERLTSLLFARPGEPNGRLSDYDPDGYLEEIGTSSEGAVAWGRFQDVADFIDLVRALNECNRQHTVRSFPSEDWSKRVRWAYIQGLAVLSDAQSQNIHMVRYTDPETVDLGQRRRFEIKTGELIGDDACFAFKICFFIEKPEGDTT